MKIQQHDGVVVDAAGIPARLHQASAGGRGVAKGEGRRQMQGCGCPPSPLCYTSPSRRRLTKPGRDPCCIHHHAIVLLLDGVFPNLSLSFAGSRRGRHHRAACVLNAEAPLFGA